MSTVTDTRTAVGPDTLGLYLAEISALGQLTAEEEKALAYRVREGDAEALATLIESNLRFVVSLAKKYARSGYPLHELINEGNLGLIEAARRFDPDRDVRFVTYASWWIRQAILAAIAHFGQAFHVPPKVKHQMYRFDQKVRKLQQELGHRPSLEEISEGLEMPTEEVAAMMQAVPGEVSLNAPVTDGSDFAVGDRIEDLTLPPIDQELMVQSFERELKASLDQLDERDRYVVERRFGLDGDDAATLAELGDELGLSRERIRQIEARALDTMRRSQRAQQLRGYLN